MAYGEAHANTQTSISIGSRNLLCLATGQYTLEGFVFRHYNGKSPSHRVPSRLPNPYCDIPNSRFFNDTHGMNLSDSLVYGACRLVCRVWHFSHPIEVSLPPATPTDKRVFRHGCL
jgi:hypothetical protein